MTDSLVDYIKANKPKVYCVLNHVSQSGMTRTISAYIIKDNEPINISYLIRDQVGFKPDRKRGGVKVLGAGMDMGFHMVYSFAQSLFGSGGGYELKQSWL
jgi:hypothetical protein